ncbi:MAG: ABC transporter permease [bacterium]
MFHAVAEAVRDGFVMLMAGLALRRIASFPATHGQRLQVAWSDLMVGVTSPHIWLQLGWHDVKQRYRRSVLGPFWLTASTGVMVVALGMLYSRILNQDATSYLPYLAVGLVVWQFMATTVAEGCQAFITAEGLIKQLRVPLSVHVFRMLYRNFIIFLHQALILVIVAVLYTNASWTELIAVPLGLVAIVANLFWLALLLGPVSARFRDVPLIVQNLVQIAFFVTPILWNPGVLGDRQWIAAWNPAYHLIELVRAPILTGVFPVTSWVFVLVMTLVGFLVAVPCYARTRGRIAFWV